MLVSHDVRRSASETPSRFTSSDAILQLAERCALKVGLTAESAEDCALAFVGRVLFDDTEAMLRPPPQRHLAGYCPKWVCRCALNHALKVRRRQARTTQFEHPWPETDDTEGRTTAAEIAADGAGPEASLLRQALWEMMEESLAKLTTEPRQFFLRHHEHGDSIRDIAAEAGRTSHAVEQSLVRTRRRLRGLLERQGLDAAELHFHFAHAAKNS